MASTRSRPPRRRRGPRMLFVSHEASRTGAPIVFLHFLRWLREQTDLDFEILLLTGGPLTDEFRTVAPTHVADVLGTGATSYIEAGIAKAGFPVTSDRLKVARARRELDHLRGFDGLYLNSTTSSLALRVLPEVPPFVASHVHELESAFTYWFPAADRDAVLRRADWFVGCSEQVARHLIEAHGVHRSKVSVHHEFIEVPRVDDERARRIRGELGLPTEAHLVGASGVQIWRKGPDLFVQAAADLVRAHGDLDVHFVWVGDAGEERLPLEADIAGTGLSGRFHIVGELLDPADLFTNLDVFCLPSREDPYPLVMLESAALGVPMVAFDAGGAREFAGSRDPAERRAVLVPYLDTEAMASEVVGLLQNASDRKQLGARGRDHVRGHHLVELAAPRLHDELLRRLRERTDHPGLTATAAGPTTRVPVAPEEL